MPKLTLNQRLPLLYRTITLLVLTVLVSQIIIYLWIQSSVQNHFRQMDSEILTHAAFNIRHRQGGSSFNSSNPPSPIKSDNLKDSTRSFEIRLPHYHPNQLDYDLNIILYNLQGDLISKPRSIDRSADNQLLSLIDIKSLYTKHRNNSFDLQLGARHYRALIIEQDQQLSLLLLPTDVHHQYLNQFNYQLKWLLTVMTLLLVSVTAVGVYWGFAPLNTFVQKMRSINAKQLDERVAIDDMPIELRPLAQSYNAMMNKLEDNFDSLSRYSDNIAHELRTPLATLMTQTQVMLSQPRAVSDYIEQLHHQHDTLEQLSVLVNNLLLLAKTQKGLTHSQYHHIHTDELLNKIISYYEFIAEDRDIEIIKEGHITDVLGDENLLQRLFANLIANATYYAANHSQIVISALPNTVSAGRLYTTIMIKNDINHHINDADTNKLFDRFYRHESNQESKMGTGLGLSIAKAIVTAHKGEITIETSDKGLFKVIISLLAHK